MSLSRTNSPVSRVLHGKYCRKASYPYTWYRLTKMSLIHFPRLEWPRDSKTTLSTRMSLEKESGWLYQEGGTYGRHVDSCRQYFSAFSILESSSKPGGRARPLAVGRSIAIKMRDGIFSKWITAACRGSPNENGSKEGPREEVSVICGVVHLPLPFGMPLIGQLSSVSPPPP